MKNILREAEDVIFQRQATYDAPEDNFRRIADFWNAYITNKPSHDIITPADVAVMMMLMKIARLTFQYKHDSIVDVAGYAQCLVNVMEQNGE